ncbi:hypothetical protein [Thalassotalea atypica]|uniref:hypothetical protein n=1 Tax=Thalassotalea atypica TaxID=2054316 RepID=UPI0025745E25|nr:hypothetical protein [Thalassotalea atypica]
MALIVDLRDFLDEQGHVVELTEQAGRVFTFLTQIVLAVTKRKINSADNHINGQMTHLDNQKCIKVDLNCNTRALQLSCDGKIAATCNENALIEWHCDTCEASGTISNWQTSLWDKQARTLH